MHQQQYFSLETYTFALIDNHSTSSTLNLGFVNVKS